MSEAAELLIEDDGAVVTVTFNRPRVRNALSTGLLAELANVLGGFAAAPADRAPRALLLTGAAGTFSSGADTREPDWRDLSRRAVRRRHFRSVLQSLHQAPFPLIAAVEGYALGGGLEFALACDLVVTGEGAQFGLPELEVGAVPGGGAVHSLIRRAGRGTAARLLLVPGLRVTGAELGRLGAVEFVVPDGTAVAAGRDLATRIAGQRADLLTAGVRLLRDSGHLDRTSALATEDGHWWAAAIAQPAADD
ncbi:enoyl-CoA hydratase/isomerase family protein [Streptomyces sp. NPDC002574]|uniref:enoyl-CoA hydratase/isomerase family protein n=1 Tax=Streptomyces sp. NPDC002574 TaxID=3364652 RepID=UPI003682208B